MPYTRSDNSSRGEIWVGFQACETVSLVEKSVPCAADRLQNSLAVIQHAMREIALAQVEPDPLQWVQMG